MGDDSIRSARDIVELWYDKGGDLILRTRRFMLRECLWIDSHTLSERRCGTHPTVSPAINITVSGRLCSEREYQRHFPEKCFILLNAARLSPSLTDKMAPDVLAASLYPLLLQTDIFDKVLLPYALSKRIPVSIDDAGLSDQGEFPYFPLHPPLVMSVTVLLPLRAIRSVAFRGMEYIDATDILRLLFHVEAMTVSTCQIVLFHGKIHCVTRCGISINMLLDHSAVSKRCVAQH